MPQIKPPPSLYNNNQSTSRAGPYPTKSDGTSLGSAAHANSQVRLPDKIECTQCHKMLPTSSYSETQKTKYMSNIHNPYAKRGYSKKKHPITCLGCTPKQGLITRVCARCHENLPLDKFSKAQRKMAEKARCLICMSKRAYDEPNFTDPEDDSEEDNELPAPIIEAQKNSANFGNDDDTSSEDDNDEENIVAEQRNDAEPESSTVIKHRIIKISERSDSEDEF